MTIKWGNQYKINSRNYTCGHCLNSISSNIGYETNEPYSGDRSYIYICHWCNKPTFFDSDETQVPGAKYGSSVNYISDRLINELYEEARSCFIVNAFTSCVLCCRKILMHISIAEGAAENLKFFQYVDFLETEGIVPKKGKLWIDKIRTIGNEANHEIVLMDRNAAKKALDFTEQLLKIVYEMPGLAQLNDESPTQESQ